MNSAMKFVRVLIPLDDSFAQMIDHFKENASVFEVIHQIIDVYFFDTL